MFVGYNSKDSVKIAIQLGLVNDRFQLLPTDGTVSCTGCTKGCSPKKFGGEWECSDCRWGGESGCKKTETIKF